MAHSHDHHGHGHDHGVSAETQIRPLTIAFALIVAFMGLEIVLAVEALQRSLAAGGAPVPVPSLAELTLARANGNGAHTNGNGAHANGNGAHANGNGAHANGAGVRAGGGAGAPIE